MSQRELLRILGYIWAAFGVYWIAVGSRVKVSQTHESPLYRVTRLAVLAITFALLFSESLSVGFLGLRFVPRLPQLRDSRLRRGRACTAVNIGATRLCSRPIINSFAVGRMLI